MDTNKAFDILVLQSRINVIHDMVWLFDGYKMVIFISLKVHYYNHYKILYRHMIITELIRSAARASLEHNIL